MEAAEKCQIANRSDLLQEREDSFKRKMDILRRHGVKFVHSGPYIESVVLVMRNLERRCPQTGLREAQLVKCSHCLNHINDPELVVSGGEFFHTGCKPSAWAFAEKVGKSEIRSLFAREERSLRGMLPAALFGAPGPLAGFAGR